MKKITCVILVAIFPLFGCGQHKSPAPAAVSGPVKKLRDLVAVGKYEEALGITRVIASQTPPSPDREEALYLESYVLIYEKSAFAAARLPLKQMLEFYPNGPRSAIGQKLLADCYYWQGLHERAMREYQKLLLSEQGRSMAGYAQYQIANCLLLTRKIGDTLTAYREVVEKTPNDPLADAAQLMVANTYLRIQNLNQAKSEMQKLLASTKDPAYRLAAEDALSRIEQRESVKKGAGVSE